LIIALFPGFSSDVLILSVLPLVLPPAIVSLLRPRFFLLGSSFLINHVQGVSVLTAKVADENPLGPQPPPVERRQAVPVQGRIQISNRIDLPPRHNVSARYHFAKGGAVAEGGGIFEYPPVLAQYCVGRGGGGRGGGR
jgi:hypothetical protein